MTLDTTKGRNPNLGFGMVPPKPVRLEKYTRSVRSVLGLLGGAARDPESLDAISEVKGLCNRIVREDQPDWIIVWLWMGLPSKLRLNWMAEDLVAWRLAYKEDEITAQSWIAERLQRAGLMTALTYFLREDEPPEEDGMGFLYLLSTRADPSLLKIGQTKRDLITRVNEINRVTGIVEPYSPRRIWRVRNPMKVEKEVHELLADVRVRKDREFFRTEMSKASSLIERHLRSVDGRVRFRGRVKKVFSERRFGFIVADDLDYFFHASEVRQPNFDNLSEGDLVSFDRLDTTFGLAAADVQLAMTAEEA